MSYTAILNLKAAAEARQQKKRDWQSHLRPEIDGHLLGRIVTVGADRTHLTRSGRREYPHMPHIARQLGHDVAVPRWGTASTENLSQRPTGASSRPVTPDRRKAGLEVSSIDGVTLSDGEGRENAHSAFDMR